MEWRWQNPFLMPLISGEERSNIKTKTDFEFSVDYNKIIHWGSRFENPMPKELNGSFVVIGFLGRDGGSIQFYSVDEVDPSGDNPVMHSETGGTMCLFDLNKHKPNFEDNIVLVPFKVNNDSYNADNQHEYHDILEIYSLLTQCLGSYIDRPIEYDEFEQFLKDEDEKKELFGTKKDNKKYSFVDRAGVIQQIVDMFDYDEQTELGKRLIDRMSVEMKKAVYDETTDKAVKLDKRHEMAFENYINGDEKSEADKFFKMGKIQDKYQKDFIKKLFNKKDEMNVFEFAYFANNALQQTINERKKEIAATDVEFEMKKRKRDNKKTISKGKVA